MSIQIPLLLPQKTSESVAMSCHTAIVDNDTQTNVGCEVSTPSDVFHV